MGMFDYVNFKANCPNCGEEETDWQTKQLEGWMEKVDPSLVNYFYTSCKNCKVWIEYNREENCGCSKHSCGRCWNHSCEFKVSWESLEDRQTRFNDKAMVK